MFTGMLDEFYDYCYGPLDYRSLRFETEVLDMANYQGNAVVNYTDYEVPYTRIIEHKHFEFGTQPKTVITREYSAEWTKGAEPYYPVNDPANNELYAKYERRALEEKKCDFWRKAWHVPLHGYGQSDRRSAESGRDRACIL